MRRPTPPAPQPSALTEGNISNAQALELERRRRAAGLRNDPLPAGGLFDLVQRDQKDLFS